MREYVDDRLSTRVILIAIFIVSALLALVFTARASAQTSTCSTLRISASLGGCDSIFLGWTMTGSAVVVSQSLVYGDGFSPPLTVSARSYSRTGVGCSYHSAVTVTQTYAGGASCTASYGDNHNRGCETCGASIVPLTTLNAANFRPFATQDAIAAAFTEGLTNGVSLALNTLPLPTNLGGVQVWVGGVQAGLFFVSPDQINFHIPAGIGAGLQSVRATNAAGKTFFGDVYLATQAPGVFTRDGTGEGEAAAVYGPGYLSLFVTGVNPNLITKADVTLRTNNTEYPCQYVGRTGDGVSGLIGLVQMNFLGAPAVGQGASIKVAGVESNGFLLKR